MDAGETDGKTESWTDGRMDGWEKTGKVNLGLAELGVPMSQSSATPQAGCKWTWRSRYGSVL